MCQIQFPLAHFLCGFLITISTSYSADKLSFNRDIRPILADKCYACHGADSAARQADLRLDKRDSAIEMKAIFPGNAEGSELIARIVATSPDSVMPPPEVKKKLSKAEIETLRRWIDEGAEYQAHWSYIPPLKAEPPPVSNDTWVKTPIDRFVLKRLEGAGLTPNAEADPRTLFRRIHLDITGLPPKPESMALFVREYQAEGEAALSRWIDSLMNEPTWGEHRARYWLDAARYGDTHGMHFDNYREMWPYRDWVIRAFNANQPYDQFTLDQLAGDLLPNPTRDQLVATGFQRCNITTNEGGTIDEENLALYAADRVQTLGWVYMGLTTNCAQCHDHKFDPLTMKDYYALAAFFRNTTQGAKDGNVADGRGPVIRVPTMADLPRFEALPAEIAAAKSALSNRRTAAAADFQNWLTGKSAEAIEKSLPSDSLLFHAPLTEGSGNESLNLCTGGRFKAIGDVAWSADGKLGPAPVMKSGSTFEVGELGDFERTQRFSVSAWVKPTNDGGSAAVVARMDVAKQHRGWDLWIENRSVGMHLVDAWPESALKVITEKPALKAGQWTHIAVSYDGSGKAGGVKVFVDGTLQKLKTLSDGLKPDASIRAQTPLRIGQRSVEQVFEGAVQEVRIYGRDLSESEANLLATVQPLTSLLKVAADKRTPEQQELLFKHYLATADAKYQELEKSLRSLESELAEIEKRSPVTHVQKEKENSPPMANILMRGEYDRVGDQVTAAIPAALPPLPAGAPLNRLGLAQWIVDKGNPLTARVAVNRFWSQVFGQGIVVTQEDFGVSGAMPSNSELLDWLAVDFQENNWDVKRFFKQLLMSAAYRQSAQVTPQKLEIDRDNLLISRGPRFRMDAEMVRDYALEVSGLLTPDMYGPPVKPYQPEGIWDVVGLPEGNTRIYQQSTGKDLYRRSMYTFWKRMAPPPNLEVFNAPSREVCSVKRERTNTPLQALVTLNDPQFVEAARALATRAMNAAKKSQPAVIDNAILSLLGELVLGRALTIGEQAILLSNKDELLAHYQAHLQDAPQLLKVGESPADPSIDVNQLAAWTMVCNQLLNLDEVLNK
jgi:Protein of unknown function (DUF1553)/Protein of unknown function (DUF1549)/Concanavalin A-like lectin/glucanases superfamily/Planctomycete cytochrome C